jgi:DNA-binding NtrC family response regulator
LVATNCDLLALQESGKFRPDLYYRLTLHRIHVPPLRERREDIPLLVDAFLEEAARELQKSKPTPPPELFTLLAVYPFPGNIRELRSMVFDAVSRHHFGTCLWRVLRKRPISSSDGNQSGQLLLL